jgi:hypothetical protein
VFSLGTGPTAVAPVLPAAAGVSALRFLVPEDFAFSAAGFRVFVPIGGLPVGDIATAVAVLVGSGADGAFEDFRVVEIELLSEAAEAGFAAF